MQSTLLDARCRIYNRIYWAIYGSKPMSKSCKFCIRLNSFVCGEPDDCCDCGACSSKESKENE